MRFVCTQENLNSVLNIVARAVTKDNTLPILGNILIKTEDGGLRLAATNLEIGVRTIVRGRVEEEGEFTVPAKLLVDYVNNLPKERITLRQKENTLEIETKQNTAKLQGSAADEFPLIPVVQDKKVADVLISDLKISLQQTVFAAAQDTSRPEIAGLYIGFEDNQLRIAGTDSFRLAEKIMSAKNVATDESPIILPTRAAQELSRILDSSTEREETVAIYLSQNQILFKFGDIEFTSRLVEGKFPDYQQIIPQEFNTDAVVDQDTLTRALKTTGLFARTGSNQLNLTFDGEHKKLQLAARADQLGENQAEVPAKVTGRTETIVLNYQYLLDGLAAVSAQEVTLKINDTQNPIMLKSHGTGKGGFLYLIMPIKA
ncbi:DNA polymerase III subunit beta [Patescibacteria group bacterium]